MTEQLQNPLTGSGFHLRSRGDLDLFLSRPDVGDVVRSSSFEQVFFTLKTLGLGDALELLPLVSGDQVRGFVDLDCWRKDSFVRRPFMEWIAAFAQLGSEEAARALSGIDDDVIALFLKDLVTVFEIERDEPPPATQLTYTPDQALAVRHDGTGDEATMSVLILDAIFKHNPGVGYAVLRRIRYTTRTELEETAYLNKVRRLDVHGFVDYFEAMSIYAGLAPGEATAPPRSVVDDEIPDEPPPWTLPTVFADSLAEGGFLRKSMSLVSAEQSDRVAEELTALGNRILSASLVNLGEVEGIRLALGEMRDVLTIGLEHLADRDPVRAGALFNRNHVQSVFKAGFDMLVALRTDAEKLARVRGFHPGLLEHPDQEFVAGLVRFKPLLWENDRYRNFADLSEVEVAGSRLADIRAVAEALLDTFGPPIANTLRQAFNTALVQQAISGRFRPDPVTATDLELFLSRPFELGPLPDSMRSDERFARWMDQLRSDLDPLAGKPIDPRFVGFIAMSSIPHSHND